MSEITKKIMDEYENIRLQKADERRARVEKIYTNFPEIKDIDKEIYQSGAKNVKNIINSPEKSDELNREYKNKLEALRNKRKKIIEENGIDPEFDAVKYTCEKCSDTGFLPSGKHCICFNNRLINYRYKRSNLSEILKRENFDTFSFDYYSKESDGKKPSPYENMKTIYSRAKRFSESFDSEEKGLVFYGAAGLGKTFLSSCIAKALMDSGKTVVYLNAPRLFMLYEDYRFNRLEDDSVIDDIYSADLLIIDDLGTEAQTKNNISFLFDLLSERLANNKKMLISTNYNMNELTHMYSSRFTSRIYESFIIYGFYGNDIRIEQLKNR